MRLTPLPPVINATVLLYNESKCVGAVPTLRDCYHSVPPFQDRTKIRFLRRRDCGFRRPCRPACVGPSKTLLSNRPTFGAPRAFRTGDLSPVPDSPRVFSPNLGNRRAFFFARWRTRGPGGVDEGSPRVACGVVPTVSVGPAVMLAAFVSTEKQTTTMT